MMSVFLIAAILTAVIAHFPSGKAIDIFTKGAGEMFAAAMMVGLGRAIQVILENGKVLDTVIYYSLPSRWHILVPIWRLS